MPTSSKRGRGLLRVVSYTLWRVSRRGAKARGFQDARDCHKFMSRIYKTRDWIICLEYLGIDDRFALNLFRLCLDAWIGFSHKIPHARSPQEGWAGGKPEDRGLPPSEGETKNIYRLFLKPITNNEQLGFDVVPKLLHLTEKVFPLRVVLRRLFGKIL